MCNEHPKNSHETLRKISTNTPKHPTYTPPGVGDRFIVPVFFLCQIRIFPLLNTCIRFIANGCPHLKIRIFKSPHMHFCSPFCGYIRICGRDKSAPTAANGLPTTLLGIGIMWQTLRKISTFNHEIPNEHSARRRGRFIVPVSLHYQIHIFASSHTYVQITTSHYRNKFTHHQKT